MTVPRWMASERPNRPRTNPKQILAKQLRRRSGYGTVRGNESDSRAARRNNNEQTRNQRMGSYNVALNPFLLPIINVPNRKTSPRKNTPAPNNILLVTLAPPPAPVLPPPPAPASRRPPPSRNVKPSSNSQRGNPFLNNLAEELTNLQLLAGVLNAQKKGRRASKNINSPRRMAANTFFYVG